MTTSRRSTDLRQKWRRINRGGIGFGGDDNPEQWPRQTWRDDVELMGRAGVTFVTLGVFSWSWIETADGVFEFDWLDEAMDLFATAGIAVDLATATATPPPWLSHAHPEMLPVDVDGRTLWPGSRQAWCPTSPVFRERSVALAGAMAARYAGHRALAMWHIGNEYACHNLPCYCDTCAAAFRAWLGRRYGTLDALNEAWGTAFWSQRYTDLAQVLPPRRTTTIPNPTHVLDYRRFSSDSLLEQFLAEKAAVREHSPDVPVTTNFMTMDHVDHLDYARWAPHVDVVSTDHYVVDTLPDPRAELAFSADLTRGLAGGPWMLMEHSTSAVNWQRVNPAKAPGATLRDALAHVARGADTVGYFQWRQSRAGAEKWHSAMLPHAGPDSARFREVCDLGALLGRLSEIAHSDVEAPVAIVATQDSRWAAAGPAMPNSELDPYRLALDVHRRLRAHAVTCDVVEPLADLSRYHVLVVPALYACTDAEAAAIEAAAAAGAHVLVTFFSGIVDEADHVRLGGYPGAFRDLLGVRAEEFFPLPTGQTVALSGGGSAHTWSEDVHAADATVLRTYADGPLAGRPAVTNRVLPEGGSATYVSAWPDAATLDDVLLGVLDAADVPHTTLPEGVEVVRRRRGDCSWLFVLDHGGAGASVPALGHDLLAGVDVLGAVTVPPGGAAVIREA